MKPFRRIPSSIRVRRTETDASRNSLYSSADTYTGRAPAPNQDAASEANGNSTQSALPPGDYFTLRSLRRGSASTIGGDDDGARQDRTTPRAESSWRPSTHDDTESQDDDEMLRLEMQAARRAIHDERQREQRRRDKNRSSRSPPGDYPPIRLSDESLHPPIPNMLSSRRPGAVEGLALRHHRQRKEERRRRRHNQHNSVSTSSTHSSTTASRDDVPATDNSASRRASETVALYPPHLRNLSDVKEERSSQTPASQAPPPNPSLVVSPPTEASVQDANPHPNRARRNTVADDGLMATSRRLYDSLRRRKSDQNFSASDEEQRRVLTPSFRERDDNLDEQRDSTDSSASSDMHEDEVVDYLDVVDPEVATVTALQNVGNSIFFPPIPMLYSRRPTISLPTAAARQPSATPRVTPQHEAKSEDIELGLRQDSEQQDKEADASRFSSMRRMVSFAPGRRRKEIPPTTEEERRKHIKEWAHMDEDERNELDEHVHVLLTKKAKFKRAARGFWRYVKTPHGFIITTYAFLITFWGTAICLFLLRWIDVGNPATQRYWIEICDQILCALFAAVGLGFAPFRAVDTYRMVQIAHYHFLTYKRRKQLDLPELKDKNELPRAAPRLHMSQMTDTMMVKTGLRKATLAAATHKDPVGSADAQNAVTAGQSSYNASDQDGRPGQDAQSADASWEVMDAVELRRSACEVEKLKEERRQKHVFLHRKKRTKKSKDEEQSNTGSQGTSSSERSVPPTQHKTYANKDGIIPLGQLKRNPSIASELPRDAEDVVVLSPKQQANLEYQQRKFHESHTFYRYRETVTHRPFELPLMMAIVILLDCHSCLQASLGGTTWGIYYKNRPTSVTATIITFSLSCNAVAGFLIWYGGNKTKKKEEVERLLGIALEEEALRKMRKKERRRIKQQNDAIQCQAPGMTDEEQGGQSGGQVHFAHQVRGDVPGNSIAPSATTQLQPTALNCIHEH